MPGSGTTPREILTIKGATVMGKFVSAALLIATAVLAVGTISMSVASAHDHTVTASCEAGVSGSFSKYDGSKTNTLTVTLDGKVVISNPSFGASTGFTQLNPDMTVPHSWHVVVVSGDGSGNVDEAGTIPACATAPPPTIPDDQPQCFLPEGCAPVVGPPAVVTKAASAVIVAPAFTG